MIMVRNSDDTYSQVGFIKDKNGVDTEYIYDKNGNVIFEKGFTREISGEVPLQINGIGKDFKEWSISGNTIQDGTPSPDSPVEIQSVGERTKNLFDESDATVSGYIAASGEIKIISQWRTLKNFIKCSGVISISAQNGLGSAACVACYDENKTLLGTVAMSTNNSTTTTLTLLDGTVYIKACSRDNSLDTYMLNLGDTPLPYEPYGYKIPVVISSDGQDPITTPIYLDKPLQIGETLNSDGTRDVKWDKVVLTGDEEWNKHEKLTNWYSFSNNSLTYDVDNIVSFCSHFVLSYNPANLNNDEYSLKPHPSNNAKRIIISTTNGDDSLDGFKAWLKSQYDTGTPVTVYYQLETPTTKIIDVPNIPTFNSITIIDTDTEVKPSNFYGKYKSSV